MAPAQPQKYGIPFSWDSVGFRGIVCGIHWDFFFVEAGRGPVCGCGGRKRGVRAPFSHRQCRREFRFPKVPKDHRPLYTQSWMTHAHVRDTWPGASLTNKQWGYDLNPHVYLAGVAADLGLSATIISSVFSLSYRDPP